MENRSDAETTPFLSLFAALSYGIALMTMVFINKAVLMQYAHSMTLLTFQEWDILKPEELIWQPLKNFSQGTIRLEYLTPILKQLTNPLRLLPKDEAVKKVVEFMNVYSINQEDFDTIVELSKLISGHPNPPEGIPPPVKSALTGAYNEGSKSRMVRAADLVTLPGIEKAPKKRIAAILEPSDDKIGEENGDVLAGSDEENSSDTEDQGDDATKSEKLQTELQSLNSKGVQVLLELKETKNSSAKKKPAGRGKGGSAASASSEKKGGRGSGTAAKRKR